MSLIPWTLYALTEKDLASVQAEFASSQLAALQNSTIVSVDVYTVPSDKILIVQSFHGNATAGAGQTCQMLELSLVALTGLIMLLARRQNLTQQLENIDLQNTPIWAPPGSILRSYAMYNSGVNQNHTRGDLTGYLIPVGNIA